jgi:hypothetical protein
MVFRKTLWIPLLALLFTIGSCTGQTATTSITITPTLTASQVSLLNPESVVQVWIGENFEANGVVIGDGSKILTVIDYQFYTPGDVSIFTCNGDNITAKIIQLDPRTGATLCALDGIKLLPAVTGDATQITSGMEVYVTWYGWNETGKPYPLKLQNTMLTATIVPDVKNLQFDVHYSQSALQSPSLPYITQGCIIYDKNGAILGLTGVNYSGFIIHTYLPMSVPRAASINSTLELLEPDFSSRPYANGPLMKMAINRGAGSYHVGYLDGYEVLTANLLKIFSAVGSPLPASEIPPTAYDVTVNPRDSKTLVTVYAHPVEIKNINGEIVARAKWVSIMWDRDDGGPTRLFYGNGLPGVEGGFFLPDDVINLILGFADY